MPRVTLAAPANPFDQDLNTTNSPQFVGLTLTGNLTLPAGCNIDSSGAINLRPSGDTSDYLQFTAAGNIPVINIVGGDQVSFFGATECKINFGLDLANLANVQWDNTSQKMLLATTGTRVSAPLNPLDAEKNPKCRAYRGTTQVVPNDTWTEITLPSERFDTDNCHSTVTDTQEITFTQTPGYYYIEGHVRWGGNATGYRQMALQYLNASDVAQYNANGVLTDSAGTTVLEQSCAGLVYAANTNDYVQILVRQNSGGNLDCETAHMSVIRIA